MRLDSDSDTYRDRIFVRFWTLLVALMLVVLGLWVAISVAGCGGSVDRLLKVARLGSEVIARAEPCLQAQRDRDLETCLDGCTPETDPACVDRASACVERVKAAWAPVIEAIGTLRDLRCELEPEKCEAP